MESWQTDFLKEISQLTQKNVIELDSLMLRIGIDDKMKLEWITFLRESIQDSFGQMQEDVKNFQNKIIDNIEELLQKSENFCKQLRIQMPPYGSGNLSLIEEQKLLKSRITEYESKIKERLEEIKILNKRQTEACSSLGKEPILFPDSQILPTMEEIYDFTNHIEKLENEKFNRETRFLEEKCKILDIINELGIKPSLEIEKTLCSPDDSLFMVTDHNMKWLDEYYESLIKQKNQTASEISNLRERITSLWEIISEDIRDMNDFMQKHTGINIDTLTALQNEVKRCENLKASNIEKFIKKLREEILRFWEKCHFSASQRGEFDFFQDDLFTEDLLTFHDIELDKMKKYYEENKEFFIKLEKREEYWKRKLELEDKATDPNRFKNRGGILLKEEREKNGLTKKINDLELDLLQLAEDYVKKHHKVFLSWGRPISDIIEETWNEFEKNKKQQLSAKKFQRANTPTPGKSTSTHSASKRNLFVLTPGKSGISGSTLSTSKKLHLAPTVGTPGLISASKRKLPPTKLFSSSKKRIPGKEGFLKAEPSIIPKIKVNDMTLNQRKHIRYSHERNKRLEKIRRLSKMLKTHKKVRAANESIDYEDFQESMNEREACRSTIFSGPSCSSTVVKVTPSKPQRTPRKIPALCRTPTHTSLKTVPGSTMNI